MELSDSQNSNDQKELVQWKVIGFIKSVLKIFGHGLVLLFGYLIVWIYYAILGMNSFFHSRNLIPFLPQLMILLIPLVVIILGALNSYSVRYIYHQKTGDSWYHLLIEGIFVGIIGLLFSVVWSVLILFFVGQQWPPIFFNFSPLFILFYTLLILSTGYASKEMTIFLFVRNKDQKSFLKSED